MKLAIVSGGHPQRYLSHINHDAYARRHGYPYYHDTQQYTGLQTPHFHKLFAVLAVLPRHDWVMWLDDDAFFCDFEWDAAAVVRTLPQTTAFVACRSPITAQGRWTLLNSGVFFVRNSPIGVKILSEAASIPRSQVLSAWNAEAYGIPTSGEQAHIIHVLHALDLLAHLNLHEYPAFNARPYHWEAGAPCERHPIVHFAGVRERDVAIASFAERFGRDATLVPANVQSPPARTA